MEDGSQPVQDITFVGGSPAKSNQVGEIEPKRDSKLIDSRQRWDWDAAFQTTYRLRCHSNLLGKLLLRQTG